MRVLLTIVTIAAFIVGAFVPAFSAQEALKPTALPIGPDTGAFTGYHLADASDPDTANCRTGFQTDLDVSAIPSLILTNNVDDPCLHPGKPSSNDDSTRSAASGVQTSKTFRFYLATPFEDTLMREGEAMTGSFWLWSNYAATFQPRVNLAVGDFSTTWNAGSPTTITDGDTGTWSEFAFDLGAAPATLKGSGIFTVSFPDNATAQRVGGTGVQWGIGVVDDRRVTLDMPFDVQPEPELEDGDDALELVEIADVAADILEVKTEAANETSGYTWENTLGALVADYNISVTEGQVQVMVAGPDDANIIDQTFSESMADVLALDSAANGTHTIKLVYTDFIGSVAILIKAPSEVVEDEIDELDPDEDEHATHNNTTDVADDEKGLPGFGLVAGLSAGLLVALVVSRRRR